MTRCTGVSRKRIARPGHEHGDSRQSRRTVGELSAGGSLGAGGISAIIKRMGVTVHAILLKLEQIIRVDVGEIDMVLIRTERGRIFHVHIKHFHIIRVPVESKMHRMGINYLMIAASQKKGVNMQSLYISVLAFAFGIAPRTVGTHLLRVYNK